MSDDSTPLSRPTSFDLEGRRVWVAGHRGMVGSAIVRRLASENCQILTVSRSGLDLLDQAAVQAWTKRTQPEVIFLAAAKVGGILANDTHPAQFLYENLVLETNIIEAARAAGVAKLVFLGSSCIYPRLAPQPMREDTLLTGPLEPTNQWYAVAKIAGLKLTEAYRREYGCDFISVMPTNLYGPGDNFDLETSHVLPALLRKFHEAKLRGYLQVTLWGSGAPLREFMHVDDCADAVVFLAKHYSADQHINVGTGEEVSIMQLASEIASVVGFGGDIVLDQTKPDGTPRKLMDSGKLRSLGWAPKIGLREGIAATYRWLLEKSDLTFSGRPASLAN